MLAGTVLACLLVVLQSELSLETVTVFLSISTLLFTSFLVKKRVSKPASAENSMENVGSDFGSNQIDKKPWVKFRRSYLITFAVVISFIIVEQVFFNRMIEVQTDYAKIINESGRMRMLSQRAVKELAFADASSPKKELEAYINQAHTTVTDLQRSYNRIKPGNNTPEYSKITYSQHLTELFVKLEAPLIKIQREAAVYKRNTLQEGKHSKEVSDAQKVFIGYMEQIVKEFEKTAGSEVKKVGVIENVLTVLNLLVIVLAAFFIFRPADKKIKDDFVTVHEQNDALICAQEEMKSSAEELKISSEQILVKSKELLLLNAEFQSVRDALDRSAIVSITDKKGLIQEVNKEFIRISGFSEEELVGAPSHIVSSHYHSKAFWVEMWKTISSGEVWRGEIKNMTKNKTYYWVDTVINPIFNDDGVISKYLSIRFLITDKKEAEIKLHQKEYDLKLAQQLAGVGSWVYNKKPSTVHMSDEMFSILGLPAENPMTIRQFTKTVHSDDESIHFANLKTLFKEGHADYRIRILRPTGEVRYIHILGQENQDSDSYARQYFGVVSDVTDQIKSKKLIEENSRQIAELLQNVKSSIHYAKRIQKAIFPHINDLKTAFNNNLFLMFRPKDIVSGDFFWFGERHGKYILVTADCTGHGVPGGFMSMLGINTLNLILNQLAEVSAVEIIEKLDHAIRFTLSSKNFGNVNDSIDLSVTVIDYPNKKLRFAGAMHDLYCIREGKTEIIRGNRKSVGSNNFGIQREFTEEVILLDRPTTVYTSSDGFYDQFGGANNKKFMKKNFKNMLVRIYNLPFEEQHSIVTDIFDKWKGKTPQTDDVLLIGMKVC